MKRFERLDDIRGITLLSMILFHAVWDLVYIFDVNWSWFYTDMAFLWQQSICWTFIILSGFCWSLGRRKLRRAFIVFGAGALISLVTEIFMPAQRIRFGILTFLGVAALMLIFLEKLLKKIVPWQGFAFACLAFVLLYGLNDGYIGIFRFAKLYRLPGGVYQLGDFGTFLGFTESSFYSSDYFSLIPWIFLYLAGYFLYGMGMKRDGLATLAEKKSWGCFWNILGKKSLWIYMLHQPVVYGVLWALDKLQVI